jgi:GT2 family glycosyltransferase
LEQDPRILVEKHPGSFNYAGICNGAAARTTAEILVFLNNDTQILSEDWLKHLVAHALLPEVGAVGAKLLFPDGRIQHVGVVIGLGNSAGHFGAPAADASAGWLSRHQIPHEVSAVTGACLAVERHKFEAIGGFDAEHLPIELNDIDFCLRLRERGWATRIDPQVRLLHKESASRGGATFRRLNVYAAQRRWFQERWLDVIRDDPHFHPGLSLYRLEPALS